MCAKLTTLAATLLVVAGCGNQVQSGDIVTDVVEDGTNDAAMSAYPMDDVIRLNQIQVKGTHNSYKVATDYSPPEWDETMPPIDVQLDELGVRQVEFDVHLSSDGDLDVYHLAFLDPLSTCGKFKNCLGLVKNWSDENPGHVPVFILIEPKDEQDADEFSLAGKLELIENEILSVFPRESIITPDDVRGEHDTLRTALETTGWPVLGQCRNKVMFIMLDDREHRDENLEKHPNLEGALIFPRNGQGESWSSILEISGPQNPDRKERITAGVLDSYLVRTDCDDPETPYETWLVNIVEAISSGGQLINTDHPDADTIPAENGGNWRMDIPGGNPAACNPQNAPQGCTSEIIENLE